jgi:uncharacterized membrane protein YhaH (DUF805 family)
MGMVGAVRTCFAKYAAFSGRARRPEYWWFMLFVVLGSILAGALDLLLFGSGESMRMETERGMAMGSRASGPSIIGAIFALAVLPPSLAVGWRRLHDTGRSGWWLLMPLGVQAAAAFVAMLFMGGMAVGPGAMHGPGMGAMWGGLGLLGMLVMFAAPLVAYVLLIVWLASPTQPGANAYGPEPPAA